MADRINYPVDAIEQILSWLPVKSVLQFRSVCKSWNALSRTHYFYHLHYLHSNTRRHLLLCYQNQSTRIIDVYGGVSSSLTLLNTVFHEQNFASMQCCDGMIVMNPRETVIDSKTWLSNPSTRETIDISFNTRVFQDYTCVSSYIGFEPVTRKYKLMVIGTWHKRVSNIKHCEILTLGTMNTDWRQVDVTAIPPIVDGPGTSFSLKGALHWLSSNFRKRDVIAFDLRSEEFRIISGPVLLQNDPRTWKLCQVDGCLTLANFCMYEGDLKLWMLRDYQNNVWVERRIVGSSPKHFGYGAYLVGSISDHELLTNTSSDELEMICYDLKAEKYRVIDISEILHRNLDFHFSMVQRESMISVTLE